MKQWFSFLHEERGTKELEFSNENNKFVITQLTLAKIVAENDLLI